MENSDEVEKPTCLFLLATKWLSMKKKKNGNLKVVVVALPKNQLFIIFFEMKSELWMKLASSLPLHLRVINHFLGYYPIEATRVNDSTIIRPPGAWSTHPMMAKQAQHSFHCGARKEQRQFQCYCKYKLPTERRAVVPVNNLILTYTLKIKSLDL